MLGNSWIAAQLAASQEGLSSMELVNSNSFCYLNSKGSGRIGALKEDTFQASKFKH
jgi:hypothetical protein